MSASGNGDLTASFDPYTDMYGVFTVIVKIGDCEDDSYEPEDLLKVVERYGGGQLPDSFCQRNYDDTRKVIRCLLCGCEISNLGMLEAHKNGKKHVGKVMSKKKADRGIPDIVVPLPRVQAKAVVTKRPRENEGKLLKELLRTCGEPVLGLKYVKEIFCKNERPYKRAPVYNCILEGCKSAWGNSVDMFNHVKNSLHLKNVLMQFEPDDKQLKSLNKNQVLEAAARVEEKQEGPTKRDYNLIQIVYSDREYDEIANRPRNWSAKKDEVENSNYEPIGSRRPRVSGGSTTSQDPDSENFFEAYKRKKNTSDQIFANCLKNNKALYGLILKNLTKIRKKEVEVTEESKALINSMIEVLEQSFDVVGKLSVPPGLEVEYETLVNDAANLSIQKRMAFPVEGPSS